MQNMLTKLWRWLTEPTTLAKRAKFFEDLHLDKQRQLMATMQHVEKLRAQLVRVQASQAQDHGNLGWQVSAFIPESLLREIRMRGPDGPETKRLVEHLLVALVHKAVQGVYTVDAMGNVSALTFGYESKQDIFVQAVFDQNGRFRVSDRTWTKPNDPQRQIIDVDYDTRLFH
jgi:hypothetical protein